MSRDLPDPTPEEVKYVLQQAILRNYPNPERKGCPGSQALKRAAEQRLPFENPDWEHTSHCSPCYGEFLEYRHEFLDETARAKRRSRIVAAAVLASFIVAGALYWIRHNGASEPVRPLVVNHTPTPAPPVPPPEPPRLTAVLNFESESATRSVPEAGAPPVVGELQRIPRGPLSLSVYLPLGSQPGPYEIHLRKDQPNSAPLAIFTGSAQIESGLTVLRISPDFSALQAGTYILAIRHDEESWRYYRVALS